MPLTRSVATKLGKKLTEVRESVKRWWLRPDGKTQVTIEFQVFDAVLDACLTGDPESKVAGETAKEDNFVGEITIQTKMDYDKFVHGVVVR